MARLIDTDKLHYVQMLVQNPNNGKHKHIVAVRAKEINEAPTVDVIPKADYENRLKADMVAMLTEIQLEFEENTVRWYVGRVDGKSDDVVLMETINDIIQEKINALKAESELQESEDSDGSN